MLALWRIAADLNWTNSFAISSGLFSHWQVWLGAAVALQVCSRALNRYGKSGDPATSLTAGPSVVSRSDILSSRDPPWHSPGTGIGDPSFSDYFPPGVKWLLIVNTAVFILYYLRRTAVQTPLLTLFALTPDAAVKQLPDLAAGHVPVPARRRLAPAVQHADAVDVRPPLERDWGTRRFLKYYFICGIGAGVCDAAAECPARRLEHAAPSAHPARSTACCWPSASAIPNQTVLMNFLFPIKAKYMVMIYAAIELLDVARREQRRQQHRAPRAAWRSGSST